MLDRVAMGTPVVGVIVAALARNIFLGVIVMLLLGVLVIVAILGRRMHAVSRLVEPLPGKLERQNKFLASVSKELGIPLPSDDD